MTGLIEAATAILSYAERKLEATAQNISNSGTAGYKRQICFTEILGRAEDRSGSAGEINYLLDYSQGRLSETGNPLDLAIHGPGLLLLRDGESFLYSRGGHFTRDEDGALRDAAGRYLQQMGGGER